MEIAFYMIFAFVSGLALMLVATIGYVFRAYSVSSQFMTNELRDSRNKIEDCVKEFGEVTKRASLANNSLAEKAAGYDEKIAMIENRMNMMNLKFNGR